MILIFIELLWKSILGRKLKSYEFVHHRDENPLNNNIENLKLTTNSKHRKEHVINQKRNELGRFEK